MSKEALERFTFDCLPTQTLMSREAIPGDIPLTGRSVRFPSTWTKSPCVQQWSYQTTLTIASVRAVSLGNPFESISPVVSCHPTRERPEAWQASHPAPPCHLGPPPVRRG
jgi:hypothetical protein